MPKIAYITRNFSPSSLETIAHANTIIKEYQAAGYKLTLRQLYYQFVSRDLLANKVTEYKRLGSIINDARLAGMIDWDILEDRTRNLADLAHWPNPDSIMEGAAYSYREDRWSKQPYRVEVWIGKEALAGVFQRICESLDVPYLSCRGYTSQSEMWGAAMRLQEHVRRGQKVLILHFGDHDPSGIDMTRDIIDRMEVFGTDLKLERIALNMDQVEKYEPPPNPAKETDSRFASYIRKFGGESWELDALEPQVLAALVQEHVDSVLDVKAWMKATDKQERGRELLQSAARRWNEVVELLEG